MEETLLGWFDQNGRDLPWRRTRDPYGILVSEVMLQQTQVERVVPRYERWLGRWPTAAALAAASPGEVIVEWQGLGYNRRALALHRAACHLAASGWPTDLTALPGVGPYTAAALRNFAFGEDVLPRDVNVERVERRTGRAFSGAAAQALMDLGATLCTRSSPRCDVCPVASDCVARNERRIDELPSPRPRRVLPQRAVRVLLFERAGAILLEKRPPLGIWGGLWSLPELALEDDPRAFARAHFGADAEPAAALAPIAHGFTHFALTLHPQRMRVHDWPATAESPGRMWLGRDDALGAALPAPIRKLLQSL